MNKVCVIAIAGGSASGKTTIANELYNYFKGQHQVVIIRQDDYYKDQTHLTMEQRKKTNYDHPLAFDNDLLVTHIKQLKNRCSIKKPTYDYQLHNRSDIIEMIEPRDIVILEGINVLTEEKIREVSDILIYVDTESDVRFIRRLRRDVEERGRSVDSVCNQYLSTVKPMHDQFVEPSKKYAHMIIPEGGNNLVAIDILITKMKSLLNETKID